VYLYIPTQRTRHWTKLFSLLRGLSKTSLIQTGNLARYIQIHTSNLGFSSNFFEGTGCRDTQLLWWGAVLPQCQGERHRKTASMCGSQQLFWTGFAIGSFDPRGPGHRKGFDGTTANRDRSISACQGAIPDHFRFSLCFHYLLSPFSVHDDRKLDLYQRFTRSVMGISL
jgi:hypothetical protein